jgi:hypothetical protein
MFEEIKPFSIPFIPGKVLYTFHMVDCHVVHDALLTKILLFFLLFFSPGGCSSPAIINY